MLYYFAGFNGYLVAGYYLRHYNRLSGRTTAWLSPLLIAAGYAITYVGFSHTSQQPDITEEQLEFFFLYCSPQVVMMTTRAFHRPATHTRQPRTPTQGAGRPDPVRTGHLSDSLRAGRTGIYAHRLAASARSPAHPGDGRARAVYGLGHCYGRLPQGAATGPTDFRITDKAVFRPSSTAP